LPDSEVAAHLQARSEVQSHDVPEFWFEVHEQRKLRDAVAVKTGLKPDKSDAGGHIAQEIGMPPELPEGKHEVLLHQFRE